MIETYEQALQFIHGRTKFKKIPTLSRMKKLCQLLGNPQENQRYIHITGTNGKGSTTAYLRELLLKQGYNVGTFTSPFIIKFNDRICLNGKMIADDDLVRMVQLVEPVVEIMDKNNQEFDGPTEFEIITAIMFLYFKEKKPDFVILEVGIGGTFDSTNIITPLVSIITNIGYDHMKYLGDTLEKIAEQKAGIIKNNIPVVAGQLDAKPLQVIKKVADIKQSETYVYQEDFQISKAHADKDFGEDYRFTYDDVMLDVRTGLLGTYQVNNSACAIMAFLLICQKMSIKPRNNEIISSIKDTSWPARMEPLNYEPLILLDGAHNEPAMLQMSETINEHFSGKDIYFLVGILADKQADKMFNTLNNIANSHVYVTQFNAPRPQVDLQEVSDKYPNMHTMKNWQLALRDIVRQMSLDDILIITGSLYFASEVRSLFIEE